MRVCPLGAFRQNRLECADPTETHQEGERKTGEKNGRNERKIQKSGVEGGREGGA